MANPLSTLGIAHTLISLPAIACGVQSLVQRGVINPRGKTGGIYIASVVLSVLTAFGLSSTGKFNAGHALGILTLLVMLGAWIAPRLKFLGAAQDYLVTLGWSASFFLLLVPGISETLRRFPPGAPFANSSESPIVKGALLGWVVLFVIGYAVQARALAMRRRAGGVHALAQTRS